MTTRMPIIEYHAAVREALFLGGEREVSTPLLTTKLHILPTHSQLVPRPRLTERMNAGSQGKLTVVSAPTGFGKSTLLSKWVRESKRPADWVSLDEGDNKLVRFLTYLIPALQGIDEGIGVDAQAALGAPQAPPVETLLTTLINDIAAFENELTLILDDCHRPEIADELTVALSTIRYHTNNIYRKLCVHNRRAEELSLLWRTTVYRALSGPPTKRWPLLAGLLPCLPQLGPNRIRRN